MTFNMLTRSVLGGALVLTMAVGNPKAAQAQKLDIVDTAVAAGSFKTLAAALQAAGLDNRSRPAEIWTESPPGVPPVEVRRPRAVPQGGTTCRFASGILT